MAGDDSDPGRRKGCRRRRRRCRRRCRRRPRRSRCARRASSPATGRCRHRSRRPGGRRLRAAARSRSASRRDAVASWCRSSARRRAALVAAVLVRPRAGGLPAAARRGDDRRVRRRRPAFGAVALRRRPRARACEGDASARVGAAPAGARRRVLSTCSTTAGVRAVGAKDGAAGDRRAERDLQLMLDGVLADRAVHRGQPLQFGAAAAPSGCRAGR